MYGGWHKMCNVTKVLLAAIIIVTNNAFQLGLRGSTDPLAVELGGAVLLPCSVETALPLGELKVEWRRKESGTLLFQYKEGTSRYEYQSDGYKDRVQVFKTEFSKGNFSLLINNITKDDGGHYICNVSRNMKSDEVTAEIIVEYLLLTGGNHAASAYVGEEVVLNCSVDSHIPPEKMEEVTWKKSDKEVLVLLFQNGEVLSDSSDERYQGRAEFFTTEISKGNFSLRLKDVRTEDKGEYICEAYNDHLTANSTVVLQQLGVSIMHKVILGLCFSAFILALVFGILALKLSLKEDTYQNTSLTMYKLLHYALVFVPNIIMSIAFILWGENEGSFSEAALCSIVIFTRFLLLFGTAPHIPKFQTLITKRAFTVEYTIVAAALYLVYFRSIWSVHQHDTAAMVLMGVMFGMSVHMSVNSLFEPFFSLFGLNDVFFMLFITFGSQTFNETTAMVMFGLMIGLSLLFVMTFVLGEKVNLPEWVLECALVLWILARIGISIATLYFTTQIEARYDDYAGLVSSVVLVQVLMLCIFADEDEREECKALYFFGAVGLTIICSVALATELIMKAQNGERNIKDLRVIILPCEGIFAAATFCFIRFS